MKAHNSSKINSHPNIIEENPFQLVRAALEVHGQDLAKYPGVIAVRPGYRFRDGCITDEPVISISVLDKKDVNTLEVRDLLPKRLGKVMVDVIPASSIEQLYAARVAINSPSITDITEVARIVTSLSTNEGIVDLRSPLEIWQEKERIVGVEAIRQEYPRPDRLPMEVNEQMTLICHASPDVGWRLLKEFLEETQENLTATMYEFTADYILKTLLQVLQPPKTFNFVMDFEKERSGLDNPQVLQKLSSALGDRLKFAWAPVVRDRVTTVGYFATSYHIKVAVRDEQSIWLSSGNWKSSNQPEIDPFDPPIAFNEKAFRIKQNRDWHIIANSPGLASQFKFFIDYDLQEAKKIQAIIPEAVAITTLKPDLFVPNVSREVGTGAKFFKELTLQKKIRIQPLLTPDNFIDHILPLIKGVKQRIWFQNQSLSPNLDKPQYMELFNQLRDHSRNPAIDTRIIVRSDFNPYETLQVLKESQFDTAKIRMQPGCHTKGIIVDDLAVIVGSHNWTGAGVLENRDASLIIYDTEVINYFAELFQHDWDNLASTRITLQETMARIASQGELTPEGMVRVPWALFED